MLTSRYPFDCILSGCSIFTPFPPHPQGKMLPTQALLLIIRRNCKSTDHYPFSCLNISCLPYIPLFHYCGPSVAPPGKSGKGWWKAGLQICCSAAQSCASVPSLTTQAHNIAFRSGRFTTGVHHPLPPPAAKHKARITRAHKKKSLPTADSPYLK